MAGGDENKKNEKIRWIPQSSPLFLHPSDNPGIMITQTIFNGENYDNWVDAVRMGLDSKNKLGFLDGKVLEPTKGDEEESIEHVAWRQCNAMIKSWLRNVIDSKLHASIAFSATIEEIWSELKDRYAAGNALRVHQLKAELTELKQGKSTVVDYYTKLKMVWDELASYSKVPKCTCGAASDFLKEKEEEKIHQLLMGLDDIDYRTLHTSILREDSMPTLSRVYGMVLKEESHIAATKSKEQRLEGVFAVRKGQGAMRGGRQSGKQQQRYESADDEENRCTYCKKWGHDEDDCWTKHGPPSNIGRGRGRGRSWRGGRGVGRGEQRQSWKANAVTNAKQTHQMSADNNGRAATVNATDAILTRDEILSLRALLQPEKDGTEKIAGPFYEDDDWSG